MKIAIGTTNEAKVSAVRKIIGGVWPTAEFFSVETQSGVAAMPLTDEEGIAGAINRAKNALQKIDSDYSVGLEGSVHENKYGMFLGGWVVILNKDNSKIGIGNSGEILLPEWIRKKLNAGEELGPIIKELMKDEQDRIRQTSGTNGILTKGLYTREMEFEHAVRTAMAIFVSPEHY